MIFSNFGAPLYEGFENNIKILENWKTNSSEEDSIIEYILNF